MPKLRRITCTLLMLQPNTARVVFSWNDADPTAPDGSDAMYHQTRGAASINLLGGLRNPPPDPSNTSSFTFRVNNVRMCISGINYLQSCPPCSLAPFSD